jgi:hypothetical protein
MVPPMNVVRFCCLGWSCLLLAMSIFGCESTPTDDEQAPPKPALSYAELQAGHAARVAPIDQLWARGELVIRWTDDKGERRMEQGEGPLIVRRPSELAFAVGKFGKTRFWLGCDKDRYWLFDLADDKRVAYVGLQKNIAHAQRQVLPLPIQPDRLLILLDVLPLPDPGDVGEQTIVVRDDDDHLVVLPPDPQLHGLIRKLRIDGQFRVTEIDLMNQRGQRVLLAKLGAFDPMTLDNRPEAEYPDVAEGIHVTLGDHRDATTIVIRPLAARQGTSKVKDRQFDFDALVKALKIDEVVDVDRPSSP